MMDSEVIKEIANQLGMAVNDTSEFLTYILPEYTKIQCTYFFIELFFAVLFLFAIVFSVRSLYKNINKYQKEDSDPWCVTIDTIFAIGSMIFFVVLLIICICDVGWLISPEGMFFNMIINKIA